VVEQLDSLNNQQRKDFADYKRTLKITGDAEEMQAQPIGLFQRPLIVGKVFPLLVVQRIQLLDHCIWLAL